MCEITIREEIEYELTEFGSKFIINPNGKVSFKIKDLNKATDEILKVISSKPVVMPSLPDGLVEGSNCDDNYRQGWIDCWNKIKGNEA